MIGPASLPAFVGRQALASGRGLDEALAQEGSIDPRDRWEWRHALAGELVTQAHRAPMGSVPPQLEDPGFDD
jgi:hypothetical protein